MSARNIAGAAALALVLVSFAARAQHEGGHAGHGDHTVEQLDHSVEHSTGHTHEGPSDAPVLDLPPVTDADRAAAFPDLGDATHDMMENPFTTFVLFDQLEVQDHDGDALASFDVDAWFGTADLARAAGHDTDDSRVVLGVRVWF